MTRTRKWLIAVLLFVMAIAVGLGALFATQSARAATAVETFDGLMAKVQEAYDECTNEGVLDNAAFRAKLLPTDTDNSAVFETVWNSYNGAKAYYQITGADNLSGATTLDAYNAADLILGNAYSVYAIINSNMRTIARAEKPSYSNNAAVVSVRSQVDNFTHGEKEYLNYATANLDLLVKAETKMAERKVIIDAAIDAVKAIEFYDAASKSMVAYSAITVPETPAEGYVAPFIVLASEDKITAVTTALEAVLEDEKIFVAEGEGEARVDLVKVYTDAVTALQAQKAKAEAVVDLIETAYAARKLGAEGQPNEVYYTLKETSIKAANDAFDGLDDSNAMASDGTTNYNDLKSIVTNSDKLTKMNGYITAVEAKFAEIATTITDNGLATPVYTQEFLTKLEAVEAEVAKLDKDVLSHEDGQLTEETPDFFITGYDVLKNARTKFNEMNDKVEKLIDRVKYLIKWEAGEVEGIEGSSINEEFIDIYYNNYNNSSALTPDQKKFFGDSNVTYKDNEMAISEVLDELSSIITANVAKVGAFDNEIAALHAKPYTFAERFELATLWERFNGEYKDQQQYVTNANKLNEMHDKYTVDDAAVKAWLAAVEKIGDKVAVADWDKVDAAVTAFDTLAQDVQDYIKALTEEVTPAEGETLTDKQLEDNELFGVYAKHTAAVAAKEEVEKAVKDITDLFVNMYQVTLPGGTVVKFEDKDGNPDFTNIQVKYTDAWASNIENIGKQADALKALDPDQNTEAEEGEGMASYVGVYAYLTKQEGWADFVNAGNYVERYAVEGKIAAIWADYNPYKEGKLNFYDYDNNKEIAADDPDFVAAMKYINLGLREAIETAEKNYDEYIEGGSDKPFIRNYNFLKAAKDALSAIDGDLKDWITEVDNVFEIEDVTKFEGYGLDLDKWFAAFDKYAALIGGEWADPVDESDAAHPVVTVWVKSESQVGEETVVTYTETKYQAVGSGIDVNKVKYVEKAYDKLMTLLAKSNEVVSTLDANVQIIINNFGTDGSSLSPEDYANITAYKAEYKKLHESQQLTLKNYSAFAALKTGAIEAATAFNTLVETICNMAVTDLTPAYVDYINAIYNGYDESIQNAIGEDFKAKLEKVMADYDKAVTDKTLPDYAGDIANLKETIDGLNTKIAALEAADETTAEEVKALKAQVTALEAALEKAEADMTKALNDAKTELEGKITTVSGDVAALKAALEKAEADFTKALADTKTALEGKISTDLTTLETKVTAAYEKAVADAKKELNTTITTLETKVDTLKTSLEKAVADGDKALTDKITAEITKVNAAIEAAKTALSGDIKTVSDGLATAKTAISNAEKAISEVKTALEATNAKVTELENANKDLKAKVDELESSVSGLVAGVVVVGVVLGLAIAGGAVVLILRRKK